jgi:toxin ParE1/3/4
VRRVEWSDSALADIKHQIAFVAVDNREAALRIAVALRDTGDGLGSFATGHPGRVSLTYEKSVRGLPYIIVYKLIKDGNVVLITNIIHTACDWPDEG